MRNAPAFWFTPHLTPAALALTPLAWVYGRIATAHGNWRAKHAYYAAVPVIGIGNLSVGGTGKTPLAEALATHYAAQGHMVAVVLRGYGGREAGRPLQVTFQHNATQVGDEAIALYRALPTGTQIWVGKHRPSVVRRAEQAGATLIILDDAFQRRDVARNANVLVIDGQQGFGNGLTLPAGPLREPLSARARAHFAVVMNEPPTPAHEAPPYWGLTAYRLNIRLLAADVCVLRQTPVLAFAGLGNPTKFFVGLSKAGINVVGTWPLPDHTTYPRPLQQQLQQAATDRGARLVTTSKDAAKLPEGFAHMVRAQLSGPDWDNVLAALDGLLAQG